MSDEKGSLKEAVSPPPSSDGAQPQVANVDAAWKFLDANRGVEDVHATEGELRGLRRKIDFRIVPMMFCCYTMQFLDKVILNVSGLNSRLAPPGPTPEIDMTIVLLEIYLTRRW